MGEIGWDWVDMKFGDLPAGAVFRVDREDVRLFIKVEDGALKDNNAICIVSSRPGHRAFAQAGEAVKFHNGQRVCMLVLGL